MCSSVRPRTTNSFHTDELDSERKREKSNYRVSNQSDKCASETRNGFKRVDTFSFFFAFMLTELELEMHFRSAKVLFLSGAHCQGMRSKFTLIWLDRSCRQSCDCCYVGLSRISGLDGIDYG